MKFQYLENEDESEDFEYNEDGTPGPGYYEVQ